MDDYINIGKILRSHGIKGELSIYPLTDDIKRFDILTKVTVTPDNKEYMVESVRYNKDLVIIKLKGINSRNESDLMRGKYLSVLRKDAAILPDNSFFIFDIIGCRVITPNGEEMGIVKEVLTLHSNDVYVILNENGNEIYLPALKSLVHDVDIRNKIIIAEMEIEEIK